MPSGDELRAGALSVDELTSRTNAVSSSIRRVSPDGQSLSVPSYAGIGLRRAAFLRRAWSTEGRSSGRWVTCMALRGVRR